MIGYLQRQELRADALLHRLSGGNQRFLRMPRLVQIEVSNRCNLFCRICTRLQLPNQGDMPLETFRRVVDQLGRVDSLWLSGQGEPLLHPELAAMVRHCADRGIGNTIVHTNGMLLEGERAEALAHSGLGELKVSIDGGNAEDVEYLRAGAELAPILENTRRFAETSPSKVSFYVVLNRRNYRSVPLLPELAHQFSVKQIHVVETVPFRDTSAEREVYDRREYQFASLPKEEKRATLRALRENGRRFGVAIGVDLKWYRTNCQEPSRKLYIDFRGNATPCCRIHHEVLVGNVVQEGVRAVWYGASLERWRERLRDPAERPRLCVERCDLGVPVRRS